VEAKEEEVAEEAFPLYRRPSAECCPQKRELWRALSAQRSMCDERKGGDEGGGGGGGGVSEAEAAGV